MEYNPAIKRQNYTDGKDSQKVVYCVADVLVPFQNYKVRQL